MKKKRLRNLAGRLGSRLTRLSGEEVRVRRGLVMDGHPLTTEVRLTLDRPRTLRFTMAEAAAFGKRTGISVWKQGIDVGELEEEQLLELLAVCCHAEDPTVTPEQLAPHIAGEKLTDVVSAVLVLIGDFMPPMPEDALENPLLASALLRLMSSSTGRSPFKTSESPKPNTGRSRPA